MDPSALQGNKSMFRKSVYEEYEEKDLVRLLEEKDRKINILEFKIERLEKQNKQILKNMKFGDEIGGQFFKKRLEEANTLSENAIETLEEMNQKVKKLVLTLKTTVEKNEESMSEVKSLLDMMGSVSISQSSYLSQTQTEFNMEYLDKLETESEDLIDELSSYCDTLNKNYAKIRHESNGLEIKYKQIIKHQNQQILTLKSEMIEARQLREKAKKLLNETQKEKADIMKTIQTMIDQSTLQQIQKMERDKLIDLAKKLLFKISETQKSKQDIIRENKKIKSEDLLKYKEMLKEVKEVKELSRLGNSSKFNRSVV